MERTMIRLTGPSRLLARRSVLRTTAGAILAQLLFALVDDGVLRLDDPLSIWMPELPDAEHVTLRMLANMTAGYPDYVPDEPFLTEVLANPFRPWTPEELIALSLSQPRVFAP